MTTPLFRCGHERTPSNTRPKKDYKTGNTYAQCRVCYNRKELARKHRRKALHTTNPDHDPITHDERFTRFPAAPLFEYTRTRRHLLNFNAEKALQRAARNGWVTIVTADHIACQLGVHPACIWPEWFTKTDQEGAA